MKPARLVVLAIALGAAGVAAMLMMRTPPDATPTVVERQADVRFTEVLAAAGDLAVGHTLTPTDTSWQRWPVDLVPAGAITKVNDPNAQGDVTGSIVRSNFLAGEMMRREKLVKAGSNAFMSAILPSGMRAVAISIDTRGATSAGGFILPNDRVDVLRTSRDEEASKAGGGDTQLVETILPNVRVLAIGQNIQERNGEKVVTGETATLEVTPVQAETLTLAQKVGQLSLALRSLQDAGQLEMARDDTDRGVTVVRYGVARQASRK